LSVVDKNKRTMNHFIYLLFFILAFDALSAQEEWTLKKEDNGIKVYVKDTKNSPLLSYKITTNVEAPIIRVYNQVLDFHENKKYLETIKELEVIEDKRDQHIVVYMVYDMPWPFDDRDLVNKMTINKGNQKIIMNSTPANNMIKKRKNIVRLNEFYETWKLEQISDEKTSVFLQGHADPEMNFPSWIINKFVVREPYSLINGIKNEAESP
jgi:hypothetical protein